MSKLDDIIDMKYINDVEFSNYAIVIDVVCLHSRNKLSETPPYALCETYLCELCKVILHELCEILT